MAHVKQNLSLGKLRREVDGNNSYTAKSMSQMSGSSLLHGQSRCRTFLLVQLMRV